MEGAERGYGKLAIFD